MKKTSKNILKYDVVFEEQKKGYTAYVPSLAGCISEGDTFEETKSNITDAIRLYLEDLTADGEDITGNNKTTFIGQIEVDYPHISI